jgi:menaquinone-dependent protoporphyrinogen oxidase
MMKTMIIYKSTHGCTEQVVKELADKLSGDITIVNLKNDKNPDFENYDRVIIGGSIHAGQIQRRVRNFCENNLEKLGYKEIGLFICCMYEGEQARKQLNDAFPEKLHQFAKTEAILGGEFNFEKMHLLEKFVVRKVANVDQSVSKIDHEAIEVFANKMEKTFSSFMLLI